MVSPAVGKRSFQQHWSTLRGQRDQDAKPRHQHTGSFGDNGGVQALDLFGRQACVYGCLLFWRCFVLFGRRTHQAIIAGYKHVSMRCYTPNHRLLPELATLRLHVALSARWI